MKRIRFLQMRKIDIVGLNVECRAVAQANETSLLIIKEIQGSHPACS